MDGLRRNVEPHRPAQVHSLVDSMESTGVYWIPLFQKCWSITASRYIW